MAGNASVKLRCPNRFRTLSDLCLMVMGIKFSDLWFIVLVQTCFDLTTAYYIATPNRGRQVSDQDGRLEIIRITEIHWILG